MKHGKSDRRTFLLWSGWIGGAAPIMSLSASARRACPAPRNEDLVWRAIEPKELEGRGFAEIERAFGRLPNRFEKVVSERIWALSGHAAGLSLAFRTDSTALRVRYRLTSGELAMPHMPATGVSGVDLYGFDARRGWRHAGVSQPVARDVDALLFSGADGTARDYRLYLPLYNGIERLELGVLEDSRFETASPRSRPIVFYGTSIVQGACASRPGMAAPADVGRRLERPTVNLGFSGNGDMDPALAGVLGEADASLYVIDCLPNMTPEQVSERMVPFVEALREKQPNVPLLLVGEREHQGAWLARGLAETHAKKNQAFRRAYFSLMDRGHQRLFQLGGADLFGTDGEGSVDGSHPSDLGLRRVSNALAAEIGRMG